MTRRGEFELIADVFGPLANDPSALNLGDDGAIVLTREGMDLVVTTDAMVEGIHFAADFPPSLLAQKLLRSNLSDLAAMGADPSAYTLTVALPSPPLEGWIEKFAQGLGRDQDRYGLALIGGDTVAATGDHDKWFSVTMFGHVETGDALRRSGARVGDTVYVSATIGDAMIGFDIAQGNLSQTKLASLDADSVGFLLNRFRLPSPRVKMGRCLHGLATAAVDISDGLVADLGHICEQSGVGAEIWADQVPMSGAAANAVALDPDFAQRRLIWGEDYELVFTANPAFQEQIDQLSQRLGTGITQIGRITKDQIVRVNDHYGQAILFESEGFQHF